MQDSYNHTLIDSAISEDNNTLKLAMTYIYDDTAKYLDFVAHRIFYEMNQNRKLIFVSKNISLETLMSIIMQNEFADSALYDDNYFYQSLDQLFEFFKYPYVETIIPFISTVSPLIDPNQVTLVLDLGSFFQSPFPFSDFLQLLQVLPSQPLILSALDSRLLSPSELALSLSHCPQVTINNIPLKTPPTNKIPTRLPTYLEINSSLIKYAQELAKSSHSDAMMQIKSLTNLKNISKTFSRMDFDNEMGGSSWQISDQIATHLGASMVDLTIEQPKMRRITSRAGVKMNWSSIQLSKNVISEDQNSEQCGDIEIKLQ
ncbi:hypothetical protein SS50377_27495 [Spironucleus salmonicida]|uniref:Uncharacterized protein n=1 Tax=Spironucleus salmonicida TaxID=348837 RepID=V6LT90_9EUKA|nr:hypothetical protein SS50377_27495 [Spironucleus salmonicida]|eukprot:EST46911.1 Hypothetical protein SS50377_13066 [Spironucleus salmonicida]